MRELYQRLHQAWNDRDADAFAALFADDGVAIGFDGSQMYGRAEIAETLKTIFADHPTGRYVGVVKAERAGLVVAYAGLVPDGQSDVNSDLNAVQTLVADDGKIVLFQNTPAAYHGRPEQAEAMTAELRAALAAS